jgi:dTDP-4-amino-4,6-dideoxygalactose transaminase
MADGALSGEERVRFLRLDHDHAVVRKDAMARIARVLDSQHFVLGPEAEELEKTLSELTGAKHAVACSSGSDALLLALKALGVGAGDAVVVPTFTFFATAGAVSMAGATPSFVDIAPETLNLGPEQLAQAIGNTLEVSDGRLVERRSGARIKAIIPVHLYGLPADVAGLSRVLSGIAGLERPPVIVEDAAQALAAHNERGRVGTLGRLACFSFYPTKNLGAAGDAGALTTDDAALAATLGELRTHGASAGDYLHAQVGLNARMGEVQAAYLNAKLPYLAAWTDRRRAIAASYRRLLAPLVDDGRLSLPPADEGQVYHQFTVRPARARDEVQLRMAEAGVDARVFYPVPLHRQPCFAHLGYAADAFPNADRASASVLSLPIYPSLTDQQVETVSRALGRAVDEVA